MQWRTSQWASSNFTAFHALMSSTTKEHWGTTENRKLSSAPEKLQAINAAKTKRHKPAWTTAGPLKTSSGGRTHEMKNEFEWHTHRLEFYSDFSAWDVDVLVSLNATGILDITQARSYFAETRLTYGDPEYVSRVLLVIHSLQLGYRMISAWMFQSDWPQINRRQHRFQCQLFWRTKTGQGWNSRLLCCPDVAA